ncbi:MAG: hypothetical protein NWQ28_13840, partial [Nodularia sp. (in: cyanobacteria)]|nr:hypothetical protein [Nodularia sp. (in: cyanobacteria)]
MFNRSNQAQSKESQNPAFLTSSPKNTASPVELPSQYNIETANNYHWNYVVGYIQRLNLGTKAGILAIAMTTLPIFGMGAIAYSLAHQSMRKQINQSHATTATRLTEQINRLMLRQYEDIQIIS